MIIGFVFRTHRTMTTPRAFDITPLTVNALSGYMRGPRTPFSPERERTFVTPPEVNPERHAQLAGAMDERRGATYKPTNSTVCNSIIQMCIHLHRKEEINVHKYICLLYTSDAADE